MKHIFIYKILNYKKEEADRLLKEFIPHLIENSINKKNTLDSVNRIKIHFNGDDLIFELEVTSKSDSKDLDIAIHGGLGNTIGKGRVTK